jgi:hypothetical protein
MSQFRSVNSLRADELFGAVTQVMRAEEAGLPFPFSGRRALTEREVTLAKAKVEAAARAKAKAAAKDKAAALAKAEAKANASDGRGTPEFGREEAKRASS